VLEQRSKVWKLHEKLMYTATERIDRDFYTAAHEHTFYMCSASEGENGLLSTETSIERIQLN
jgi:hypothetical protein